MRIFKLISFSLTLVLLFVSCQNTGQKQIDLSGQWRFQKDSNNVGMQQNWYKQKLEEKVKLPGSMAINGKGNNIHVDTKWTGSIMDSSYFFEDKYAEFRKKGNIKVPFWLQPQKHYIGPAWYQKEITIPENWDGRSIELYLERCHWETTVWIDDQKVGSQNMLATPHVYDLSDQISSGQHRLTIRVDNRVKKVNPGQNSHSITDHTQTNWNGIVGQMELRLKNTIDLQNTQLYPDIEENSVEVQLTINNDLKESQKVDLELDAKSFNTGENHNPPVKTVTKEIKPGKNRFNITYTMGEKALLWNEFNPHLYKIKIGIETGQQNVKQEVQFGMREVDKTGNKIRINGKPTFLRGTLFCAGFPKTGYPEMGEEWWADLYEKIQEYGLNHIRFHSWCPPEAAFKAADRAGVYLQVESSSWANQGASIGNGKPIDKWLYKQTEDIIQKYGNHPSFVMMAYGNEPAGDNQEKYLSDYITHWKNKDDRRIYTGGSGWPVISKNEFHVISDPRIQHWGQELESIINSETPSTDWDWEKDLQKYDSPVVSHEIGQWCAYPDFSEIDKYTGVLKARNFEIFQETLKENHMGELSDEFLKASGELQTICYKADIEGALRTENLAGFQLLGLHDFSGQGTALVGVLNAFWKEKGYVDGEEFSQFCNYTVPLAELDKRNFVNNENFKANLEVFHYGKDPLQQVTPEWKIVDRQGKVRFQGKLQATNIKPGGNTRLGKVDQSLGSFKQPQKLTFKIKIDENKNSWDFWVYPAENQSVNDEGIQVVRELNQKTKNILDKGGKVLLTPSEDQLKDEFGGDIGIGFSSIFWNTAWTGGQAPHTLGILCDPEHSALEHFPTEFHANWQWWDAMSNSHAILLDGFAPELDPIVRVIDTWFENRRLGLIYEVKVGQGKLLISGIDLLDNIQERPEAQQLLYSLKKYMISKDFQPKHKVDFQKIKKMYKN